MTRAARGWAFLFLLTILLGGDTVEARSRRHRRESVPPPPRPLRSATATAPLIERAADDAVLVIPSTKGQWVLTVLWPRAEVLDAGVHARAAVEVAALVAIDEATAGLNDSASVDAVVRVVPAGVMVGFSLPSGGASIEQLVVAAERLATPPAIDATSLDEQIQRSLSAARQTWNSPALVARAVAMSSLYPGFDGFPCQPEDFSDVNAADALSAIADVRTRRIAVRAIGPSGLASSLASSLRDRLGHPASAPTPTDSPKLPSSVAIVQRGGEGSTVALAAGFRAQDGTARPDSLALFAEALDEGDASLPQRLAIACGASVTATVSFEQVGARGGALLFEATVPRSCAAQALAVMRGTIESLHGLPLREDVVASAWQRRERAISVLLADPLVQLDSLAYSPGQVWPPALRDRRELHGSDLTAAARVYLDRNTMVSVLAGNWPEEALPSDAKRAAWDRFSATGPQWERALTAEEESAQFARAGESLARELLSSLSEGLHPHAVVGHTARYRVTETTPLGIAEAELQVKDSEGATTTSLHRDAWTLEAATTADSPEVAVRGATGATPPTVSRDRITLAALRQPAVLAQAVLDGRVVGYSALATCAEGTCPALRAEPGDGSRLLLLLDGKSRLPKSLRVWWSGSSQRGGPHEEVEFLAWTQFADIRVASDFQVDDALGGHRRLTLLDWKWTAAP
ncbi:MAG: hypothetical protein U0V87_12760 [Acidobacteriota bacterium]